MFETLKGVDGNGEPWQVCEAALFIMKASTCTGVALSSPVDTFTGTGAIAAQRELTNARRKAVRASATARFTLAMPVVTSTAVAVEVTTCILLT